jgi:hypothetical protein
LNEVLRRLLNTLTFKHNSSAECGTFNVLWTDGNFTHSKPVVAAWLAVSPAYSELHHLEPHVGFGSECPQNVRGDYVPPEKQYPLRNHNLYRTLSNVYTKAANAELTSPHVHRAFSLFRNIQCIVSDLPKPVILHTMQIGMLDHLQNWIFHFMKTHERLDKYKAIWLSMPAYYDLTPNMKSYEVVSQCNGKEMKEMSRCLLGVVTHVPRGGSPTQRPVFNHTIECTRALLEFYMYAQYKSQDDATVSYMEDPLHRFHTLKDVFLLGRGGKKAVAKANALSMELVKKRKVEKETNAETWTLTKKWHKMNA